MLNVRLAGGHLYGKQLFIWLSLVVSLMTSFCAFLFFQLDVLDEIWDVIESASEGFLTYSCKQTRATSARDIDSPNSIVYAITIEGSTFTNVLTGNLRTNCTDLLHGTFISVYQRRLTYTGQDLLIYRNISVCDAYMGIAYISEKSG